MKTGGTANALRRSGRFTQMQFNRSNILCVWRMT
jgi:hypothetical protein